MSPTLIFALTTGARVLSKCVFILKGAGDLGITTLFGGVSLQVVTGIATSLTSAF